MPIAFLDDLARPVDVLALDEPAIAHVVPSLENALGADASREGVGEATFAGYDSNKAAGGTQHALNLA